MSANQLKSVADAIRAGNKERARDLLRPILAANPTADAWYLAAHAASSREQAIMFLHNALKVDPFHKQAAKALAKFDGFTQSLGDSSALPRKAPAPQAPAKKLSKRWRIFRWVSILILLLLFSPLIILELTADKSAPRFENSYPTVDVNSLTLRELPDVFCDTLQARIAAYGTVTTCSARINQDNRLEAEDVNIRLTNSKNYGTSLNLIEVSLRTFAEVGKNAPGYIVVLTEWSRGGRSCTDNAGMGYAIMNRIDWARASQKDIFQAIDKNSYGDQGEHYSTIAWSPDESGIAECNE